MPTVLVTGASRGLGLEFCRQYADAGWRVIAAARNPDRAEALQRIGGHVDIHRLDVADAAAVEALADRLAGQKIDVLINNAGLYGAHQAKPPAGFDLGLWRQVIETNLIAPYAVARAFLPQLRAGERRVLAFVSSIMGSIAQASGGAYPYRTSKAGLNMLVAALAADLRGEGLMTLALHPGWARTDMGGPNATVEPRDSVAGMRQVIAAMTPERSGRFYAFDGNPLPW